MVSFDIFLKPNELFESDSRFTRNMLYVKDLIKAIKTPSPSMAGDDPNEQTNEKRNFEGCVAAG